MQSGDKKENAGHLIKTKRENDMVAKESSTSTPSFDDLEDSYREEDKWPWAVIIKKVACNRKSSYSKEEERYMKPRDPPFFVVVVVVQSVI